MKRKWFDKKVLILGLSKSGVAAAEYLTSKGAECFITEKNERCEKDNELIESLEQKGVKLEFGRHSDEFFDGAYTAITSPGIPPQALFFRC